jgi:hypothetical protein
VLTHLFVQRINAEQIAGVKNLATYRITYTDTRFDDLSEEESICTIEDLFKQGELRLDTDKRVNMLSMCRICKDELQNNLSSSFICIFESFMNALEMYEKNSKENYGSADKLLVDSLSSVLQARAK